MEEVKVCPNCSEEMPEGEENHDCSEDPNNEEEVEDEEPAA